MIRLTAPTDPALWTGPVGSPIITAQLQAQAASAGGGILREFWVGDGDGLPEASSWLCRSGSSLWATVSHPAAAPQAAEFLQLLGGSLVQVDDPIRDCLLRHRGVRRPILAWAGDAPPACPPAPGLRLQIAPPGDASLAGVIMDLHTQAGEVPPGERWDTLYAELHLRCRRQAAAGAVLWEGKTAVACGALGSIGAGDAVVSHVCTLPRARRRGLAAQVVTALCQLSAQLGRRPVLCCREELLPLYRGVGFCPTGQGHWIIRTGEPL